MALNLDPASIAEALRKNVESWTRRRSQREEVGRVIESGDGIARVAGLPRTMANELLEFPGGLLGHGLQPRRGRDRLHHLRRRRPASRRATRSSRPAASSSVPVGDGFLGRVVDGLGRPIDDKGPIAAEATTRTSKLQAPNVVVAPAREGTDVHGHHRDRRDDGDRPRPAPADHRRPADREDRRRARHDHQPEAVLGHRRGREMHLRGDRSEGLDGGRGGRDPPRERCPRVHGRRERRRLGPRAVPVRRAVLGRGASARTGCTRATPC